MTETRQPSSLGSARVLVIGLATAFGLWAWTAPDAARADETFILTVEPGLTAPLTEPQEDWYGAGGTAALGAYHSLAPWVVAGLRGRASIFSDGTSPQPTRWEDPDLGGLYTASAALRLRPFASAEEAARGTGLWVEGAGGVGLTDDLVRPVVEAGVGYTFEAGAVNIGPVARYQHVFEPDDGLSPEDGRFVTVGLELGFFDARPEADPEPVARQPAPEPEPRGPCADVSEDFDGFEDEDGCPDPDNDGDGILDVNDACPNEAEVFNGINDHDGCPDQQLAVVDDRLVLDDRILFDFDEAHLRASAPETLRKVQDLWAEHPEWTGMRIEGHADVRGTEEYNIELSRERAEAVKAGLVAVGMDPEFIDTVGYGESEPRDYGDSPAAHQRNRRVEFVVVRRPPVPEEVSEMSPAEGPEGVEGPAASTVQDAEDDR